MKKPRHSALSPAQLSPALNKNLNAYALGAAAVGVAALASPQAVSAEIIYTPANQHIHDNMKFDFDVNGDGVTDFILVNRLHISTTPFGDDLSIQGAAKGNSFVGEKVKFSYFAGALPLGGHIGSKQPFLGRNANMAYASLVAGSPSYVSGGPWKNAKNRYLGLKFMINGEVHYGWARLTVLTYSHKQQVESVLTGYAYETVANQSIKAGQMSNSAEAARTDANSEQVGHTASFLTPPTLGLLALGSPSLPLWRREE